MPVFTKPLPASPIPDGGRCGSTHALHVVAGPFIKWGGTIGLRFGTPLVASTYDEEREEWTKIWDGIAFWARVGTGSCPTTT
ncbi:MAG: hypothetical protein JW751_19845 [Polyangiaceae bacterium]|nr:hypothetical protein [Polyangiaceae bacterium]